MKQVILEKKIKYPIQASEYYAFSIRCSYMYLCIYNFRCNSRRGCVNYYNDAVGSTGCFFSFLSLSSVLCCSLDIKPVGEATDKEKLEESLENMKTNLAEKEQEQITLHIKFNQ